MGRWDLTILYPGFDSEQIKADMRSLNEAVAAFCSLADKAEGMDGKQLIKEFIARRLSAVRWGYL